MGNSMLNLLKGDFTGDTLVVSLKSSVPVFIAHPEIIIPFKAGLTDVVPFYLDSEDYEDDARNIVLPDGTSATPLIVLFTKVFEMVVKLFNSGASQLTTMPKVVLKVDIGSGPSQFEIIQPTKEQVLEFDNLKTKMFTFTGHNAAENADKLSYSQKHNLLLVDILTRKYNNSGLGGRS